MSMEGMGHKLEQAGRRVKREVCARGGCRIVACMGAICKISESAEIWS